MIQKCPSCGAILPPSMQEAEAWLANIIDTDPAHVLHAQIILAELDGLRKAVPSKDANVQIRRYDVHRNQRMIFWNGTGYVEITNEGHLPVTVSGEILGVTP